MKKIIVVIACAFSVLGCNSNGVSKPDNLIEKEKMIDILSDISLLEAIKMQNITGGITSKQSNDYIYKKYKIDSIQFTKSNKYYASDLEEYKKMYLKVKEKLNKETLELDAKMKKNGTPPPPNTSSPPNPDTPQVK